MSFEHPGSIKPTILHYHITSRCPFRCKHCCVDAGLVRRSSEMRLEEMKEMVDEAVDYGMDLLDISGGEPLTRGRQLILELIEHASKRRLLTSLNTNAYYLSGEYASELAVAGLDRVKLSLYGASPKSHEEFTGVTGSFNKVIRGIEALKTEGLEVWVHYVTTPKNVGEIEDLPSLLNQFDVDVIQFGSVIPSGRGANADNYRFPEEELTDLTRKLENWFPDALSSGRYSFTTALYPPLEELPYQDRFCDYFTGTLPVDSEGGIIPCCILPRNMRNTLGNIENENFCKIYTLQSILGKPVPYWLWKGHKAMMETLGIEKLSPNLCSLCIDMLNKLKLKWHERPLDHR